MLILLSILLFLSLAVLVVALWRNSKLKFINLQYEEKVKEILSDYEKELVLFVIDMYVRYGEALDIFPSEDKKKILLERIEDLNNKITTDNGEHK